MPTPRQTKDRLNEQFAQVAQAFASPKRIELLDLLCQCEKTVEAMAKLTRLSVANTSRHLQILRRAHLVDTRREGSHVFYRLADDEVWALLRSLRRLAESRLAQIDRIVADYFGNSETLQPTERAKLLQRARAGEVIVLDVRPSDEYREAHLPHARSVPLSELMEHLDEFASDREIVAYCRGPYCVLAQQAVRILAEKGFTAVRLEDGVAEWKEAGLPIVSRAGRS